MDQHKLKLFIGPTVDEQKQEIKRLYNKVGGGTMCLLSGNCYTPLIFEEQKEAIVKLHGSVHLTIFHIIMISISFPYLCCSFFSITSCPPIYGRRTFGTLIALSSIKLFSMMAIRALVFATSVEFSV